MRRVFRGLIDGMDRGMKLTFIIFAFVILSINLSFSYIEGNIRDEMFWVAGILILTLGIRFRKWIGG